MLPFREDLPARGAALLIALVLCAAADPPAGAQISSLGTEKYDTSYLEPLPDEGRRTPSPQMSFRLDTEIPLPGPLPGGGPRLADDRVLVPVAGGLAESGWADGCVARVEPPGKDEPESPDDGRLDWVPTPDGRARFAVTPDGLLVAQKRCPRCLAGWRRRWKLRVAGQGLAPPLVTEERLFYGAMDNRVYGLKRRNGHRVWETDLEARVLRPLRMWQPPAQEGGSERPLRLILAVPGDGKGIVALDSRSGAKVASYALPEDGGTLVGAPVVTPDGKIVVARQKYTPSDASLMVFSLVRPPKPA